MSDAVTITIEAPAECLDQLEEELAGERQAVSKSISAVGGDPALIIEVAKAAIPAVSAALGAAAAMVAARTFKVNNIETRGYSTSDLIKLLEKLAELEKKRD